MDLIAYTFSGGATLTEADVFFYGIIAGFVVGGSGFLLRVVRQAGRQNPEL